MVVMEVEVAVMVPISWEEGKELNSDVLQFSHSHGTDFIKRRLI